MTANPIDVLRDYRTTDPDAIGALLREVAAGGED